jgi:hypothetical protein
MDEARQLDLACLLGEHWQVIVAAYPAGLPTMSVLGRI